MQKLVLTLCFFMSCSLLKSNMVVDKPLSFDGTKDSYYVVHSHRNTLRKTKKATLAAWIKPERLQDIEIIAVGAANKLRLNTSRACLKITANGGLQAYARSTDGTDPRWYVSTEKGDLIKVGQWSHIATLIHYDQNKVEFFVNGEKVQTKEIDIKFAQKETPDTPSTLIALGSEEDNWPESGNYMGLIAQAIISNKIEDIKKLAAKKP